MALDVFATGEGSIGREYREGGGTGLQRNIPNKSMIGKNPFPTTFVLKTFAFDLLNTAKGCKEKEGKSKKS